MAHLYHYWPAIRYSEAIDILYSTTIFNFTSYELLRSFPSLVLPHRFAAITSIEQIWTFVNFCLPEIPVADKKLYNEMWSMLASMPNLRHITIAIATYECPIPVPADIQEQWLEPLKQLQGKDMETFEILVPESYGINFHVDEASQFKLITFPDVSNHHVCRMGTCSWIFIIIRTSCGWENSKTPVSQASQVEVWVFTP